MCLPWCDAKASTMRMLRTTAYRRACMFVREPGTWRLAPLSVSLFFRLARSSALPWATAGGGHQHSNEEVCLLSKPRMYMQTACMLTRCMMQYVSSFSDADRPIRRASEYRAGIRSWALLLISHLAGQANLVGKKKSMRRAGRLVRVVMLPRSCIRAVEELRC
ncbi:hypothetical protein CCHR01_13837 [Colletotrichum chrysophilum]|uniref:Uncharacterized protein n=1 Tax=Colletotrichum chrysophilum TaxID=1836956 RepID=A0AAD9AAS1_9PEZI|nr:hypothetical protein K456DRAFT_288347 [Colletotrichum gloeosporioides 23]KAK1843535.1 hypothetical protein CCHR01_13837 [Colletotrichum chrysophilum]